MNPQRQATGIKALILLLLIGLALLGSGLAIFYSSRVNSSWTKIEGTVIRSTPTGAGRNLSYLPVVKYTVSNQSYTVTASSGTSIMPLVGSLKEVAYNPDKPTQAKVVETTSGTVLAVVFGVMGVGCIILGSVSFIKSK